MGDLVDEISSLKLSDTQEVVLKQIWAHLLQLWGYTIDDEWLLLDSRGQEKSVGSGGGGGLLGKFGKSGDSKHDTSQTLDEKIRDSLKDMDPKDTKAEFWNTLRGELPDDYLQRFARARKWDFNRAFIMLVRNLYWRAKVTQVNDLLNGGEVAVYKNHQEGIIKNLEMQKAVVPCTDLKNRPVILVRPKLHYSDQQSEEELEKFALLVIEQTRLFMKGPVRAATILFDLTGFSLSNMDYAPVKFLVNVFEAHYPEYLGHLIIHKAPWVFSPIWSVVKAWLDPVVASKVKFTYNRKDLEEHISNTQMPKYLGGSNEYDLEQYHAPDGTLDSKMEESELKTEIMDKRKELIEAFISTTIQWIKCKGKDETASLARERAKISAEIHANYLSLDPYIRSRSVYDINGAIRLE